MKYNGRFLVEHKLISKKFRYKVINQISEFSGCDCIIIKNLNPDFSILLSNIQLIITEKGSALSHLAVVAREYGKSIILVENIINKTHKTGLLGLRINPEGVEVEIK